MSDDFYPLIRCDDHRTRELSQGRVSACEKLDLSLRV